MAKPEEAPAASGGPTRSDWLSGLQHGNSIRILRQVLRRLRFWQPGAVTALGLLSFALLFFTFRFATQTATWRTAFAFTKRPLLFLLNWLPLACWLFFWFFALGRAAAAYGLTAVPVLAIALVNYYKLLLRGDPLLFSDITLLSEASAIGKQYVFTPTIWGVLSIVLAVGVVLLLHRMHHTPPRPRHRLLGAVVCLAALCACIKWLMPSTLLYAQTGLNSTWMPTQSYTQHGVLYPFLHSISQRQAAAPEGYDEKDAARQLAAYTDADIPKDEQVDVIAVMLEAFNDFTTFDSLSFAQDPYEPWHQLMQESYTGTLVTNIFAGGTVNTERAFLTGYLNPTDNYRAPVNSFVWYFRSQGYTCQGDHPGYDWFYNRQNINRYLGFETYRFYEDTYQSYATDTAIARDSAFLQGIIEDYEAAKQDGKPIFNYSLTYQNHGPYDTDAQFTTVYLPRAAGVSTADYNIANNYFTGVADTCRQLSAFVDHFRTETRPVVIVLFGDHNPWWGDDNTTYEAYGVNIDRETEEGFYNYYSTPYLIWANDAAREALGCDFTGEGGRIAPALLMERLFTLSGWDGPAYMQAQRELETHTTVVNCLFYQDGTALCPVANAGGQEPEWLLAFRRLAYYWRHSAVTTASR